MAAIQHYLVEHTWLAWVTMPLWFAMLARAADIFVASAVALANRLGVPKLVVGIVLVSLATTAPEFFVSVLAALRGSPEMALGNAVGSVICDDGLALPLAGLFAAAPIAVMPSVLKTSGIFLVIVQLLLFGFVIHDGTLSRIEGIVLVACFVGYIALLFRQHKAGKLKDDLETEPPEGYKQMPAKKMVALFIVGLAGLLIASHYIVISASTIAGSLGIPEGVIALSLVAFGTSIPEVATCVSAVRKNHGALAVGNILGADILNICWVAGASAIANPLTMERDVILFMFPSMFVIVGAMLLLLRHRYRLTKLKSLVLLGLYIVYLVALFAFFLSRPMGVPAP